MKIPIFPGKYHQNGGFSMAMLVSGRVHPGKLTTGTPSHGEMDGSDDFPDFKSWVILR